jgi:SNF2 family DNA or RNA helicase
MKRDKDKTESPPRVKRKRLRRIADRNLASQEDKAESPPFDEEEEKDEDSLERFIVSDFSEVASGGAQDSMEVDDEHEEEEEAEPTEEPEDVREKARKLFAALSEKKEKQKANMSRLLTDVADVADWGTEAAVDARAAEPVHSALSEAEEEEEDVRLSSDELISFDLSLADLDENEAEDNDDDDDEEAAHRAARIQLSPLEEEWDAYTEERKETRMQVISTLQRMDKGWQARLRHLFSRLKEEEEHRVAETRQSVQARRAREGARLLGLLPAPMPEMHTAAYRNTDAPWRNSMIHLFHQLPVIAWILLREVISFKGVRGGILADEMGLGKTMTLLTVIALDRITGYEILEQRRAERHSMLEDTRAEDGDDGLNLDHMPSLVVCPNSIVTNWVDEAKRFYDPCKLDVLVLKKEYTPDWQETLKPEDLVDRDLIVINYEALRNLYKELHNELSNDIYSRPKVYRRFLEEDDEEEEDEQAGTGPGRDEPPPPSASTRSELERKVRRLLAKGLDVGYRTIWSDRTKWKAKHVLFRLRLKRLILDESTQCKNDDTLNFRAALALKAVVRWNVSGTPLENNLDELYSQFLLLGFDRSMHSIRDKQTWHRLLLSENVSSGGGGDLLEAEKEASEETAAAANASLRPKLTPASRAVAKLKTRVLNVCMARREIHNVNAIDLLRPYLERAFAGEEQQEAWDRFVRLRTATKMERNAEQREDDRMKRKRRQLKRNKEAIRKSRFEAAIKARPPTSTALPEVDEDMEDNEEEGEEEEEQRQADELTFSLDRFVDEADLLDTMPPQSTAGHGAKRQRNREALDLNSLLTARSIDTRMLVQLDLQCAMTVKENKNVPSGFYWYTRQSEFRRCVKLVDHWMQRAFGLSLAQLSQTVQDVRTGLAAGNKTAAPLIHASLTRLLKEPFPIVAARFPVMAAFSVPEPIIFVAKMQPIERAVYQNALQQAKQSGGLASTAGGGGGAPQQQQQNVAFRCITRCRSACADYRTAANAPVFLEESRGKVWDVDGREPCREVDIAAFKKQIRDEIAERRDTTGELDGDNEDENAFYEVAQKATSVGVALEEEIKLVKKMVKVVQPLRLPTKYLMTLRAIEAIPANDKIIIFSDLVSFFPDLAEFLVKHGIKTIIIDGTMDARARQAAINQFNTEPASKARVLLASLKCADKGLNLQVANWEIFLISWWNGAVDEQAKRRILRAGQKKDVHYIYLVLLETIEELVLARGGEKSEMITSMIGDDDGLVKTGSNFSRPDTTRALLMDFEQGPYGPIVPEAATVGSGETRWGDRGMTGLLALPRCALGAGAFATIRLQAITTAQGKLDRTKLARALIQSTV